MRFLPSKHYKNDIPSEAVFKIKALAKKHQTEINKFKILAPAKALELEDENIDPLLFIPLTKNKFYLIHKWGKDLSWSRRIKVFPLQNLETIIFSVGILALITALITPTSLTLKIFKKRLLTRYKKTQTYWVDREESKTDMTNQF